MDSKERPRGFDELQASAERQLALLEQQALGHEMALDAERRQREVAIKARTRDRWLALALVAPGVLLAAAHHAPVLVPIAGSLLSAVGCAFWMRSKGRSPWLGVVGAIPLLGVFALAFLKDRPP